MKRVVLLLGVFIFSINIMAQDAQTLLGKMDKVMFSAKDKQGVVQIILTNRQGKEKVREAVFMQKGDKSLYRYTKPESQAGIATLSLPDGVMWLYMPAFGKPKKISLLAKSQAFTGTDFSYEDMSTLPYSERYTPKLLETNDDSYLLELKPKSEDSKYSKILLILDKEHYYPIKMQYYSRNGQKFKEATYIYEKVGDYWNAKQVIMADLNKQHMTKILLADVKFNQGIPDSEFTVENLVPKEEKKE
jgi:outer membrane lipoprotein-sorting protein